jgi:hypothetical protein
MPLWSFFAVEKLEYEQRLGHGVDKVRRDHAETIEAEQSDMYRTGTLALCALAAAWAIPLQAQAQTTVPAAADASAPKVKAKKHSAARHKKADSAVNAAPAASQGYELVPTDHSGSAQARARQNSFSAPDDDTPDDNQRHIGIGLGGSNGMTPGMTMGF